MPALKVFGRRWHIASDDLPLPAAALSLFHLVWVALLIVWFVTIHGPSHCQEAWEYDLVVGGLLGTFLLSFCLELWITREALQGSLFEPRRRRRIPTLIYLDCASVVAQVGLNAYGTHLIYTEPPQCELDGGEPWNPVNAMKGLVWSTWAIIAALLALVFLSYNLFPDFEDPRSWEKHCRCLGFWCCCCDREDTFRGEGQDGEQTLMMRLGRLFAMMFGHVDTTPSDIVVSFALAMTLQRMQRARAQQAQQAAQEERLGQGPGPAADGDNNGGETGGPVALGSGGGGAGRRLEKLKSWTPRPLRAWPWPFKRGSRRGWAGQQRSGAAGEAPPDGDGTSSEKGEDGPRDSRQQRRHQQPQGRSGLAGQTLGQRRGPRVAAAAVQRKGSVQLSDQPAAALGGAGGAAVLTEAPKPAPASPRDSGRDWRGSGRRVGYTRSWSPQSTDPLLMPAGSSGNHEDGSSNNLVGSGDDAGAAAGGAVLDGSSNGGHGRYEGGGLEGNHEGEVVLEILPDIDIASGAKGGSGSSTPAGVAVAGSAGHSRLGGHSGAAELCFGPEADLEQGLGVPEASGAGEDGQDRWSGDAALALAPNGAAAAAAADGLGGKQQQERQPGQQRRRQQQQERRRHLEWSESEERRYREDVGRTSSFMPNRVVRDNLAMGATKTSSDEEGQGRQLGRADTRRGEHGEVEDSVVQQAAHYMKVGWVQLCCGRSCGFLLGMCCPHRQRHRQYSARHRHQGPFRGNGGGRVPVPVPDLRVAANLNREAIQQATGLSNEDLCFSRYEGEVVNVLPYYICLDNDAQQVILAIRGSLSLEDVVRDLLFEPAELQEWAHNTREWHEMPPEVRLAGPGCRVAAHSGILDAARHTLMDIQGCGVLHSLLLAAGARCAGWRLVLVGHSLGAACAFLLGLYMRRYLPDLRCWAFSPPGGLASGQVGAAAADWCTSMVCGKEWIPRLTVNAFNHMRDEMVYAAARCRQPKLRVLAGLLRGKRWEEGALFYPADDIPREAAATLHAYHASLERPGHLKTIMEVAGDFTVPGRVIHLKPVGTQMAGRWRQQKRRLYRAVWIDAKAVQEEGILISGRMWADHMPDYCLATLSRMVRARRHHSSTASVGDNAGEAMVNDMMGGGGGAGANGAGGASAARPPGQQGAWGRGGEGGMSEGGSEYGSTAPSESEGGRG
ncbi:hypothetical protein N2152v2_003822 [Parachlorella kessleri]